MPHTVAIVSGSAGHHSPHCVCGAAPVDGTAEQVTTAFGHRGIAKLTDVVKSGVTTLDEKNHALQLLISDMSTQEKKAEAIRAGVVSAAKPLLHVGHDGVRANAAVLLSRVVLLMQGRTALNDCGGIAALTANCGDKDAAVRGAASGALANLAFFRDGWEHLVKTRDAVAQLVRCLDVNAAAVDVFVNVTAFYAEGSDLALHAGVVKHLVRILNTDTLPVHVHEQAALTVRHLVVHDAGTGHTYAVPGSACRDSVCASGRA